MTRISRRQFSQLGALFPFLGTSLGRAPFVRSGPLRDRPRLAVIGVWNRGRSNLEGVLDAEGEVKLLADVDSKHLGLAAKLVADRGQAAPQLMADWRAALERPRELDGVVISTPDHLHAPIASAALARGLAVYCEKPLAHTVEEARLLQKLAHKAKVATQMGIQIHAGDNYRRVVEAVRGGAIGDVREVHVLCSKSWSDGRYGEAKPVPEQLAFDLWLGPAAERPYTEGLHPAWWRKFWDFGTGTVGDMACHWVDLVHWALELGRPSAVTSVGPEVHPDGTPAWLHTTWEHPAAKGRPAVAVHWWDGGKRPEIAREGWNDCHIWVGSKGRIYSTYSKHEVVLDDPDAAYEAPKQTLAKSRGHYVEWIQEIQGGERTSCPFDYSAPLTEAVLLATVAFRAGAPLKVDVKSGAVTGADGVEALLTKSYRAGFGLTTA
ncbi:MAG: Gfo/Idh/MocA family oxidoreductase [Planctomycetota bacterium]